MRPLILSTALIAIATGGAGAAIAPAGADLGGRQAVTAGELDAVILARHNCPGVTIGNTKVGLGTNTCLYHPPPKRDGVRDHRDSPEIRDHRSEPEIRDHRTVAQIRDHREPTAPTVRDHRSRPRARGGDSQPAANTASCAAGEMSAQVRGHRTSPVWEWEWDYPTNKDRVRDLRTDSSIECR